MGDREVTGWVSGSLHELLGYSDSTVAQFLVAAAKKCGSVEALRQMVVEEYDFPAGAASSAFAAEFHRRVNAGRAPAQPAARRGPTQAEMISKSQKYSLLDEEDAPRAAPRQEDWKAKPVHASTSGGGNSKRQKRARREDKAGGSDGSDDDDDDTSARLAAQRLKRAGGGGADGAAAAKDSDEATAAAAAEEAAADAARDADLKERDELVR